MREWQSNSLSLFSSALKKLDLRANWQTMGWMTGILPLTISPETEPAAPVAYDTPYTLDGPAGPAAPVLFASPHSGNEYPERMQSALCVPLIDLRRTEDAFVEELFADAPALGATLMAARYGRSVADLNRDPRELDATMFSDGLPRMSGLPTARVDAGLGALPRVASRGEAIYARRLTRAEGEERLRLVHDAYHDRLGLELGALRDTHGAVLLIDCHSMPSADESRQNKSSPLADIVLGDYHGKSCDPLITDAAEQICRDIGLSVTRNKPYAGGYTTKHYGQPKYNFHCLQIEIKRSLYMDELRVERGPGLAQLIRQMRRLINTMTSIDFSSLIPPSLICAE